LWGWIIIACHAQHASPGGWALACAGMARSARTAHPGRVRLGFRNIHAKTIRSAAAPKPGKARPRTATRVEEPPPRTPATTSGENTRREVTLKARKKQAG